MFQKFNLLILAVLYLIAQGLSSSWPTHFQQVAAWNIPTFSPSGCSQTIDKLLPSSGDQKFALTNTDISANGNSTEVSYSRLEMRLPEDFSKQKFLRFKINLVVLAKEGNFQFSLRNNQGIKVCEVQLGFDGKIWLCENVGDQKRQQQLGTIRVNNHDPMELVVGLNLSSSEVLVAVDGANCRSSYVQALDSRSIVTHPSDLQTVGLEFCVPKTATLDVPGHLIHLTLDEVKI